MDQEVELPADALEGTAAVTPPAGEGQANPGAGAQPQRSRAEERIKSLTGRLTGAEQAAARERDRAEAAERRAAEAERRAEMLSEAGHGLAEKNTTEALTRAKEALRRAVQDGDTDGQAAAMEAIAEAKATALALQGQKPQQRQETPPQQQPVQQARGPSPQAQAWTAENPWFLEDKAKQARALAIHAELLEEGYADGGKAYFKELTARTRDLARNEGEDEAVEGDDPPAQQPARPHAGAGVTRTAQPGQARPGTKVRLTAEEVEAARDLGISVEQYAAGKQREIAAGRLGGDRSARR